MNLLLLLLALSPNSPAAVFGTDNRLNLRLNTPEANLARSTAVALLSTNFEIVNGRLKLDAPSLAGEVCPEEKFSADPSLSYACSGFLVAPDVIATAGHCMVNVGESRQEKLGYCEAYSWLFDYAKDEQGAIALHDLDPENLYRCREVIYAVREEHPPYRDFALVQLDRPVANRPPLRLSSAPLNAGPYSMIGYPLGTPAKLAPNAKILLNNPSRQSFITNLDALDGNSGSPVFNSSSEVVGILVAGTPSQTLFPDPVRGCQRYNICDENGKNCRVPDAEPSIFPYFQQTGSEVQRIAPIMELLKKTNP
jgi:hypothetical protein